MILGRRFENVIVEAPLRWPSFPRNYGHTKVIRSATSGAPGTARSTQGRGSASRLGQRVQVAAPAAVSGAGIVNAKSTTVGKLGASVGSYVIFPSWGQVAWVA